MKSASDISSPQGITQSQKEGEKPKETSATETPLEGAVGGHSVSIAGDIETLAIASAEQDMGVTELAEHALLRLATEQKASREVTVTMPVVRNYSEKRQLERELEAVNTLRKYMARAERKSASERKRKKMLERVNLANRLRNEEKLKDANEALAPVFEYTERNFDTYVTSSLYRSKAHILCMEGNIEKALHFFKEAEEFDDEINFPDRLFILYLRLGIDINNLQRVKRGHPLPLFQPDSFYEDIKKWITTDQKTIIGIVSFLKKAPQVKIFYNGIKAIFHEEKVSTETPPPLPLKKQNLKNALTN